MAGASTATRHSKGESWLIDGNRCVLSKQLSLCCGVEVMHMPFFHRRWSGKDNLAVLQVRSMAHYCLAGLVCCGFAIAPGNVEELCPNLDSVALECIYSEASR